MAFVLSLLLLMYLFIPVFNKKTEHWSDMNIHASKEKTQLSTLCPRVSSIFGAPGLSAMCGPDSKFIDSWDNCRKSSRKTVKVTLCALTKS